MNFGKKEKQNFLENFKLMLFKQKFWSHIGGNRWLY